MELLTEETCTEFMAELAWDLVQRDDRGEFRCGDDSMCPFYGCSAQWGGGGVTDVTWPHEKTCPVSRARAWIAWLIFGPEPDDIVVPVGDVEVDLMFDPDRIYLGFVTADQDTKVARLTREQAEAMGENVLSMLEEYPEGTPPPPETTH